MVATLLFLDWVRFPAESWAAARGGEPAPLLKVSAITYNLASARQVDEVSYFIQCDAVQKHLSEEDAQRVLGMSKIVYRVSTGKLETILPALLDKLDAEQVTPAVWDIGRFNWEFRPHLLRALADADAVTRSVYSRLFVLRDVFKVKDAGSCDKATALEASRALNLDLRKDTELEALSAVFRALNPDGAAAADDVRKYTAHISIDDSPRAISREISVEDDSAAMGSGKHHLGSQTSAITAAPTAIETGPFVIRLRGLPWETTAQEIADFLAPVLGEQRDHSHIHPVTGSQGRCSGEAYVDIPTAELREKCLEQLYGNLIGRRWIEVFKASPSESRSQQHYVPQQRESAAASSPTWFDVRPEVCSSQLDNPDLASGQQQDSAASQSGVLRMRGLPWGSTEYDVMRFFSDGGFPIDSDAAFLPPARGTRCSGEAWVDFGLASRADEARRAMHRKCIGSRYIEIFPSSSRELHAAQRGLGSASYGPASAPRSRPVSNYRSRPYSEGYEEGRDYHPQDLSQGSTSGMYRSSSVGGEYRTSQPRFHHSSSSRSNEPVEKNTAFSLSPGPASDSHSGVAAPSVVNSGNGLCPFYGGPSSSSSAVVTQSLNNWSTSGYMPPLTTSGTSQPSTPSRSQGPGPRKGADPYAYSVLRLRGLPYGSNENHIVHFFSGYSMSTILPSTVPVDGRPSGEAYVEFTSPEEAMRAYQQKQKARIDHRYIELFPASKQEMEYAAAGLDAREIRMRLGSSTPVAASRSQPSSSQGIPSMYDGLVVCVDSLRDLIYPLGYIPALSPLSPVPILTQLKCNTISDDNHFAIISSPQEPLVAWLLYTGHPHPLNCLFRNYSVGSTPDRPNCLRIAKALPMPLDLGQPWGNMQWSPRSQVKGELEAKIFEVQGGAYLAILAQQSIDELIIAFTLIMFEETYDTYLTAFTPSFHLTPNDAFHIPIIESSLHILLPKGTFCQRSQAVPISVQINLSTVVIFHYTQSLRQTQLVQILKPTLDVCPLNIRFEDPESGWDQSPLEKGSAGVRCYHASGTMSRDCTTRFSDVSSKLRERCRLIADIHGFETNNAPVDIDTNFRRNALVLHTPCFHGTRHLVADEFNCNADKRGLAEKIFRLQLFDQNASDEASDEESRAINEILPTWMYRNIPVLCEPPGETMWMFYYDYWDSTGIFSMKCLNQPVIRQFNFNIDGIVFATEIVSDTVARSSIRMMITGDLVTRDLATRDLVSGDLVTRDLVSGDLVSGDLVTGDLVSGDLVSGDPVTGDLVSGDLVSGDLVSEQFLSTNEKPTEWDEEESHHELEVEEHLINAESDLFLKPSIEKPHAKELNIRKTLVLMRTMKKWPWEGPHVVDEVRQKFTQRPIVVFNSSKSNAESWLLWMTDKPLEATLFRMCLETLDHHVWCRRFDSGSPIFADYSQKFCQLCIILDDGSVLLSDLEDSESSRQRGQCRRIECNNQTDLKPIKLNRQHIRWSRIEFYSATEIQAFCELDDQILNFSINNATVNVFGASFKSGHPSQLYSSAGLLFDANPRGATRLAMDIIDAVTIRIGVHHISGIGTPLIQTHFIGDIWDHLKVRVVDAALVLDDGNFMAACLTIENTLIVMRIDPSKSSISNSTMYNLSTRFKPYPSLRIVGRSIILRWHEYPNATFRLDSNWSFQRDAYQPKVRFVPVQTGPQLELVNIHQTPDVTLALSVARGPHLASSVELYPYLAYEFTASLKVQYAMRRPLSHGFKILAEAPPGLFIASHVYEPHACPHHSLYFGDIKNPLWILNMDTGHMKPRSVASCQIHKGTLIAIGYQASSGGTLRLGLSQFPLAKSILNSDGWYPGIQFCFSANQNLPTDQYFEGYKKDPIRYSYLTESYRDSVARYKGYLALEPLKAICREIVSRHSAMILCRRLRFIDQIYVWLPCCKICGNSPETPMLPPVVSITWLKNPLKDLWQKVVRIDYAADGEVKSTVWNKLEELPTSDAFFFEAYDVNEFTTPCWDVSLVKLDKNTAALVVGNGNAITLFQVEGKVAKKMVEFKTGDQATKLTVSNGYAPGTLIITYKELDVNKMIPVLLSENQWIRAWEPPGLTHSKSRIPTVIHDYDRHGNSVLVLLNDNAVTVLPLAVVTGQVYGTHETDMVGEVTRIRILDITGAPLGYILVPEDKIPIWLSTSILERGWEKHRGSFALVENGPSSIDMDLWKAQTYGRWLMIAGILDLRVACPMDHKPNIREQLPPARVRLRGLEPVAHEYIRRVRRRDMETGDDSSDETMNCGLSKKREEADPQMDQILRFQSPISQISDEEIEMSVLIPLAVRNWIRGKNPILKHKFPLQYIKTLWSLYCDPDNELHQNVDRILDHVLRNSNKRVPKRPNNMLLAGSGAFRNFHTVYIMPNLFEPGKPNLGTLSDISAVDRSFSRWRLRNKTAYSRVSGHTFSPWTNCEVTDILDLELLYNLRTAYPTLNLSLETLGCQLSDEALDKVLEETMYLVMMSGNE